MIQAIVFSKNRAAQLDFFLRSAKARATMFEPISVLFTASNASFMEGYHRCQKRHPEVVFCREHHFQTAVETLLEEGSTPYVSFFCDDDVFFRPLFWQSWPNRILDRFKQVLCVSLRLGENTLQCYPMNLNQKLPVTIPPIQPGVMAWEWKGAIGDWGYPGSLDGHVFRRHTLREILREREYTNPNRMEDQLNDACKQREEPYMASYTRSLLVNIPANRVNSTHPNRFGEHIGIEPEVLNAAYLGGKQVKLASFHETTITAAHVELPLVLV